ncbi:glycosyltransferase family 39 protein [Opitutus sp. GAS368]|uniref:ArnT family glycosyltransferase n=1 Tax=Opitutus sp. GAS368 TaxID=1882749 RepID=UPI00087DF066|nr:glycosyltransferase family 39 protein [Opitutus sp. GAS368]SDS09173.1 4-amino-4-deoxy-L-arabinose transferase [Opitutus sp. GAS368]
MPSTRSPLLPSGLTWLALLLALGHAVLATLAMREKSTTADELAHVTGGYTFDHWNDYRMQPENGNLPQRWQALPTALRGAAYPPMDTLVWRKSEVWLTGHAFFYETGNDPAWMLFAARAMNSLFGAALVLLVYFWSRGLWGEAGALVSAAFAALCPTMLAHSGLATSDMCMAFFLLAASGAYWRHLHDGRWRTWWLSALVLGLAAVAKYTAVLLLPLAVIMAALRVFNPAPLALGRFTFRTRPGRLGAIAASTTAQGLVAVAVIWAFFGFRYGVCNPALPPGEFNLPWDFILSFGGLKAQCIQFGRDHHLLPEGWLYGLAFVLKHAEARAAFLDGEYSIFGWVDFFPKTFLYKTPPALLAALAASAGLLAWRFRALAPARLGRYFYRVTPLLALFAVYWFISLTSHLNIGHRHILPTYPVLYILAGALGWAMLRAWHHSRQTGAAFAVGLAALVGWQAATAAQIYPHYLAYFSPLVGGPAHGYQHLVDSSLDWGQDLPALQHWLHDNRRPGERVYLSYFGTDEPARYVPDAVLMPRLPTFDRPRPWHSCEPGLYAISATMLSHVYQPQRGPWTLENERLYQLLRQNDVNFRRLKFDPSGRPEAAQGFTSDEWTKAWKQFEQLRFARLCHYLRARQPDAQPGYSILVYRLDQAELDAALNGDLRQLAAAIERAHAAAQP